MLHAVMWVDKETKSTLFGEDAAQIVVLFGTAQHASMDAHFPDCILLHAHMLVMF